jgi:catechol 2,3-dioxygenase-like lactoylglutathione lyase family enzyme
MFNAITHSKLFVLDQDQALDFYVGKLGFEVGADFEQGPVRWLTVSAPGQPGHQIYLEKPGPPAMSEETAEQVRDLLTKGALGWLALHTDDCRKLYEAWKERGVEFTQEPIEHFYGTDCGVRDPFGNQIRVLQPAPASQQASSSS